MYYVGYVTQWEYIKDTKGIRRLMVQCSQNNNKVPCYILAIETSCDETAVAIVKDGCEVLSNVISSQIQTHQMFGGVVPEVASRQHVEVITVLLEQALSEANLTADELCAIAVTQGPGLVGALLVGIVCATTVAMALGKPLIRTHHIAGHIYANQLVQPIVYPAIALVVSGGHTELVYLRAEGQFSVIGKTRDDAVGEAYDKVARVLGCPYPGGPHIDRMAREAVSSIPFPRVWLEADSYDFSLSGLKSAVLSVVNQANMREQKVDPLPIAKGFQEAVIDVLVHKAIRAVKQYDACQLLLCGGVAANVGLRNKLQEDCITQGIDFFVPPIQYCTDNAAMIGAAAYIKWKASDFSDKTLHADPSYCLETWSISSIKNE